MAQASHQIVNHFHQQCTKTQLIEIYTAAYKFHKSESDKFKSLLSQLSNSLVSDLDLPEVKLTYDVTDQMKQLLVKKNEEL